MVQIHSPRPFLLGTNNLQTQIYSLTAWCCARRSAVQIESLRLRYSRSLIDLHCDCVMFSNRWKLSHLSNDFTNGQGIRLFGGQEWMPNLFWSMRFSTHQANAEVPYGP
jgi:hypothetical protein